MTEVDHDFLGVRCLSSQPGPEHQLNQPAFLPRRQPGPGPDFPDFRAREQELQHFRHLLVIPRATRAQAALNRHFLFFPQSVILRESQESVSGTNWNILTRRYSLWRYITPKYSFNSERNLQKCQKVTESRKRQLSGHAREQELTRIPPSAKVTKVAESTKVKESPVYAPCLEQELREVLKPRKDRTWEEFLVLRRAVDLGHGIGSSGLLWASRPDSLLKPP